jgi:hypothetical protein
MVLSGPSAVVERSLRVSDTLADGKSMSLKDLQSPSYIRSECSDMLKCKVIDVM